MTNVFGLRQRVSRRGTPDVESISLLRDNDNREVDVHVFEFDQAGNNVYGVESDAPTGQGISGDNVVPFGGIMARRFPVALTEQPLTKPTRIATAHLNIEVGRLERGDLTRLAAARALGVSRATVYRLLSQKGSESEAPQSPL